MSNIDILYIKILLQKISLFSIDATEERGEIGRMINHSRRVNNISPRLIDMNGTPRLFFIAKRDVAEGEELLYDYGDSSPSAVKAHPWLLD